MTKPKIGATTDSEFDDISSFSSIDSYKPEPFTGFEGKDKPVDQATDSQDAISRGSTNTLSKRDSNTIAKVVTHNALKGNAEMKETLEKEGLNLKDKSIPDINAPLSSDSKGATFPEEYRLETETGLVKLKTLDELSRKDTRVSISSNGRVSRKSSHKTKHSSKDKTDQEENLSGYSRNNLDSAIEKNKHEIEKYQKHKHEKGLKGFMHRLFD